jgi:HEAT repeat protein
MVAAVALWAGILVIPIQRSQAQPPADFQARLDATMTALARYDVGVDNACVMELANLVAASHGQPSQRKALAARLAELLGTSASCGAKGVACRQLSLIGTAESVPALAPLLGDAKLSHMARFALERIPGPAADQALRQALGKLKGNLRVGVIHSLGNRRDAQAAWELFKLVRDADLATATSAAVALGKIGPPAAAPLLAEALLTAPDGTRPEVRAAVANACVMCAEKLLAEGKTDASAALYYGVLAPDVPKATRIAALRGAILALPKDGMPLLVKQLRAADARQFALALSLARELRGAEVTQALAEELPKLPPERQALLVVALADRGDKAAMPAVLGLAREGDPQARVAAIQALARLGDASTVAPLLELARGEGDLAQAAQSSLARLPGANVDASIIAALTGGDAKQRRMLLEVLGQRYAQAAVPALIAAAADADAAVRLAALKALGEAASVRDLAAVAKLLVSAKGDRDTAATEAAIGTLCARAADKNACAQVLLATLPQGTVAAKAALLRALGQVGGSRGLEAVRAAISDPDPELRDAAIRVLSNWLDDSAAPDLFALAGKAESRKHRILALQGYIRLAGLAGVPNEKKLAMCQLAMGLAQRDDEKRRVLGALGQVQSPEALAAALSYLELPTLKNEAGSAAVSIGERIVRSQAAAVGQAMQKVLAVADNKDVIKRAKNLWNRTQPGGK